VRKTFPINVAAFETSTTKTQRQLSASLSSTQVVPEVYRSFMQNKLACLCSVSASWARFN